MAMPCSLSNPRSATITHPSPVLSAEPHRDMYSASTFGKSPSFIRPQQRFPHPPRRASSRFDHGLRLEHQNHWLQQAVDTVSKTAAQQHSGQQLALPGTHTSMQTGLASKPVGQASRFLRPSVTLVTLCPDGVLLPLARHNDPRHLGVAPPQARHVNRHPALTASSTLRFLLDQGLRTSMALDTGRTYQQRSHHQLALATKQQHRLDSRFAQLQLRASPVTLVLAVDPTA
ncbi:hypothetical protein BD289DRAFT_485002 [Coniella lustricola]|uniref:Uncharacterized protein n=1 Tax=Coniella lustricola TaxID=2025994 RepID=A0A2T3A087_9PEZI|nr:hypothetical protein BD289DRAFT_485002 [Coniella lustricola]